MEEKSRKSKKPKTIPTKTSRSTDQVREQNKKKKKQMKTYTQNLPWKEPVLDLRIGDCQVIVLGTAHISIKSVKSVIEIAESFQPDTICVELCESRLRSLSDPEYFKKLDIFRIFKERKMFLLMSSLILSSFQKKMGKGKIQPGDELRAGIRVAEKLSAKLIPIDREIQTTLRRVWTSVGLFSKLYLISALITSLFVKEDIPPEKIEEMKSEDVLNDLFSQLPARYNKVKKIIIDERDQYLAQNIRKASRDSRRLLAIVGAGHLRGIQKYIQEDRDIRSLDLIPPKTLSDRLKVLLFPLLFGFLFIYGFLAGGREVGTELVLAWIVVKAGLAGLGAIFALAHPISILLAMLTAPVGNFNPVIKPGWVAALSESWLRKPKAEDFENIARDSETLVGYWKNRVIRIFLVFVLPQLGSSIGTFLVMKKGIQILF